MCVSYFHKSHYMSNCVYASQLTCIFWVCKFLHVKCQKLAKTLSKIHADHKTTSYTHLTYYRVVWQSLHRLFCEFTRILPEIIQGSSLSDLWIGLTTNYIFCNHILLLDCAIYSYLLFQITQCQQRHVDYFPQISHHSRKVKQQSISWILSETSFLYETGPPRTVQYLFGIYSWYLLIYLQIEKSRIPQSPIAELLSLVDPVGSTNRLIGHQISFLPIVIPIAISVAV